MPSLIIKSKGGVPTRFHPRVTISPEHITLGPVKVAEILLALGSTVTVSMAKHPGFSESVAIT